MDLKDEREDIINYVHVGFSTHIMIIMIIIIVIIIMI